MEKKRTYGVWAVRSSTSIFGPAQSWCKENGKPLEFDTKAAAENYAKEASKCPILCERKRTGARCCSERNISTGAGCTQP